MDCYCSQYKGIKHDSDDLDGCVEFRIFSWLQFRINHINNWPPPEPCTKAIIERMTKGKWRIITSANEFEHGQSFSRCGNLQVNATYSVYRHGIIPIAIPETTWSQDQVWIQRSGLRSRGWLWRVLRRGRWLFTQPWTNAHGVLTLIADDLRQTMSGIGIELVVSE